MRESLQINSAPITSRSSEVCILASFARLGVMVGNFLSFILIIGVLADVLWGSVVDAQQANLGRTIPGFS